jgi:DNA uptake protein ComE-like DNA-binding protein
VANTSQAAIKLATFAPSIEGAPFYAEQPNLLYTAPLIRMQTLLLTAWNICICLLALYMADAVCYACVRGYRQVLEGRAASPVLPAAQEDPRVSICDATVEQLCSVDGIGKTIATRIVASRPASLEELASIKGVGPVKLQALSAVFACK